jgi:enamine deaminase RidA (YjgF/YER057c/UK114 family)
LDASVRNLIWKQARRRLGWQRSTPSLSRRQHLGSLDKVTRVVRLGVAVATSGDVRELPKVADGASELLQDVFGKDKNPSRLVYGVVSLPLGTPVELEVIFEVS